MITHEGSNVTVKSHLLGGYGGYGGCVDVLNTVKMEVLALVGRESRGLWPM